MKRITNLHNIFQQALGASEKVFAYLDQPEEIEDVPGARKIEKFRDRIAFENVSFILSFGQRDATRSGFSRDPRR